jgi:hypothetical protein
MRTKTIPLYHYDELPTAEAKEKARDGFGRIVAEDFDADTALDDAATLAELMGLDIRQLKRKRMDGSTYSGVSVSYSLYGQGRGAWFTGAWRAVNVKPGKVAEHAPQDAELARIAGEFERIAHARPDASVNPSESHRAGMRFNVETNPPEDFDEVARTVKEWEAIRDRENIIAEELRAACRDFAQWIYCRVLSDYEWQTAAEQLAEGIRANEYEFREDGTLEN